MATLTRRTFNSTVWGTVLRVTLASASTAGRGIVFRFNVGGRTIISVRDSADNEYDLVFTQADDHGGQEYQYLCGNAAAVDWVEVEVNANAPINAEVHEASDPITHDVSGFAFQSSSVASITCSLDVAAAGSIAIGARHGQSNPTTPTAAGAFDTAYVIDGGWGASLTGGGIAAGAATAFTVNQSPNQRGYLSVSVFSPAGAPPPAPAPKLIVVT